ncbi:MAG: hypothetical protein WCF18_20005 [Chthoniobacteraceae bacterium]
MTRRSSSNSRGSILIVVLWASIGLVSIALLFGHSMMLNYRGSDNDLAGRQADAAIEGAIKYAESLLANAETAGLFPDPTSYEAEAMTVGEATFWLLGRPEDPGSGTTREFGLVDEAAKLNLNAFSPQEMQQILQDFPGMTQEIMDAIVDWRDPNGTGNSGGGISATTVKHAPFESVEELALVGGMTRQILYGEDANLNGVLDTSEDDGDSSLPADNSDGKLDAGLMEYFTVFSREPNVRSDTAAPRVDVRNPSSQEMADMLAEKFEASRVTQILAPFRAAGGGGPPPSPPPTSPMDFFIRSGMTADEFDQIVDLLSTQAADAPYIVGRVNVNTASEVVLSHVPGLDVNSAAALVSARLSNPPQTTSIAWVRDAIGDPAATVAGRYITGQSFQASVDVAAVGRHGRGYRRERVVIDTSDAEKGPRVIYRRNLAPLGWALGRDVRENLALKKDVR